jgi:hypothetical protein
MEPTPTMESGRRPRWERREHWKHRHSPGSQLALGIFLMTIGVLLTLDRLQIINTSSVLRLWPVGFIALGATILLQRGDRHGRFWGFGWLFLGVWLLLNTLGILRIGFWDLFWPLLLLFIGVRLITRSMGRTVPASTVSGTVGEGVSNLFAVLGESKRSVEHEPFRGAHMTALLGGCVLDLRQAALAPGEQAVVDVFGFMAGLEIVVPTGWNVVSDVAPILGAVEDKRLPALAPDAALGGAAPRLSIRGLVMLGGLTIKS